MSINSVFDGLRDRRLEVIQGEMSAIIYLSLLIALIKVLDAK